MKKSFLGLFSILLLMILSTSCQQATTPAPDSTPIRTLGSNQVALAVVGIVWDGLGNPIPGVSVGYSDGVNSSISRSLARDLQAATSNDKGQFELKITNANFLTSSSTWIVLSKGGYTAKKVEVALPAFSTVTAQTYSFSLGGTTYTYPLNVGASQTVNTTTVTASSGPNTTTVATQITPTVEGFKVATDIGTNYLFQLAGEATGTVKLLNDAVDQPGSAVVPPTGSIVTFSLPGTDYSPYLFQAITDANGNFTFSSTGSAATPGGQPNPLPVYAEFYGETAGVFFNSSEGLPGGQPILAVRANAAGGNSDSAGMALYIISSSVNPGIQNLSILPPNGSSAFVNKLGNADGKPLLAVADHNAMVTSWTPLTNSSGATVYMDQLTGSTATPITLTFNKKMDTTNTPVAGIKWVNYNPGNSLPTLAWDTTSMVATITPAIPFPKGTTVELYLQGWLASDGTTVSAQSMGSSTNPISFAVKPGLTFVRGAWTDSLSMAAYVALTANGTGLVFNQVPATFDTSLTKLWDLTLGREVPATFALTSATTSLDATLQSGVTFYPGHDYEIRFSVSSGQPGEVSVSYDGTTATPSTMAATSFKFTCDPTSLLKVLSSNAWTTGETGTTTFIVTNPITLTFNKSVVTSPAPSFALFVDDGTGGGTAGDGLRNGTETLVIASVATSDNLTFTITPTAPLDANAKYGVQYLVYGSADKLIVSDSTTANAFKIGFTTSPNVGISLVNSNTWKTVGIASDTFPLTGTNVQLTFDNPVVISPSPTFTLFSDNGLGGGTAGNGTQDGTEPTIQTTVGYNAARTQVTLTVANGVAFSYGQKLAVYFQVYASATGAAYNNGAGSAPKLPFTAVAATAPKLVSSNTYTPAGEPTITFPISGTPITLVFDSAIENAAAGKTPAVNFTLTDTGAASTVNATYAWASATNTLTITPAPGGTGNLSYGEAYSLSGTVFSPLDTTVSAAVGPLTFTTVKPTKFATAPSVALDTTAKSQADTATAKATYQYGQYAFGETTAYLLVGYLSGVSSYDWQYKYSTDLNWTTGVTISVATTPTDGTSPYRLSVPVPALDPAKQPLLIQMRANYGASFDATTSSDWSSSASLSITQRPSTAGTTTATALLLGIPGLVDGTSISSTSPGTVATTGSTNTWTLSTTGIGSNNTYDRYYGFGITLNGTEKMTALTTGSVVNGTPAPTAFSLFTVLMSVDGTQAYVILKVPAGTTNPLGQLKITVSDVAGNQFDNGTSTTTSTTDDYLFITIQ